MGTRGLIGFYKKGVTKAMYNHFDSYPSELGVYIKEYIADANASKMNGDFDRITLVNDSDTIPSERRDFQGCIEIGQMVDGIDFIKDSLFCEWAYLINLDRGVLEVYRGFQHKPAKNRYALTKDELAVIKADLKAKGKGEWYTSHNCATGKKTRIFHKNKAYYNCDLIAQIPLEDVQSFNMELFEKMVRRIEDMSDEYSCGNVLDPKFDFTPEIARSTTIPMTYRVLGLVSVYDEE